MKVKPLEHSAILHHITPLKNSFSIKEDGLLTSLSRGKRPVLWFVSRDQIEWGIKHTARLHGTWSLMILTCEVEHPIRTSFLGLFVSKDNIPFEQIRRFEAVQYTDDPEIAYLDIDPKTISVYQYRVACPMCGYHDATIIHGKKGRILAVRCTSCKSKNADLKTKSEVL